MDIIHSCYHLCMICFFLLYNLFYVMNLPTLWKFNPYYCFLYLQVGICGAFLLFQKYPHFTFLNLVVLFFIFILYPNSNYTLPAIVYDIFLLVSTILLILRRQDYEEITTPARESHGVRDTEYPPALDLSNLQKNHLKKYVRFDDKVDTFYQIETIA